MISDAILPWVISFTPVSDRLCILKLEGRFWDIVIINCYAPTEQGNNDIKCEFYEELERIYDTQPRNCIKILMGDFNAQIGREPLYRPIIGRESLHLISNNNGMRVINFATSKDLVLSMNWKKKKQHKPRTKKFSAEKAKNPAEFEAYQINLTGILNRESVLQNDIDET
ncbi:hypothetical protein QTP88_000511 [Uroleucon formosanum]